MVNIRLVGSIFTDSVGEKETERSHFRPAREIVLVRVRSSGSELQRNSERGTWL